MAHQTLTHDFSGSGSLLGTTECLALDSHTEDGSDCMLPKNGPGDDDHGRDRGRDARPEPPLRQKKRGIRVDVVRIQRVRADRSDLVGLMTSGAPALRRPCSAARRS